MKKKPPNRPKKEMTLLDKLEKAIQQRKIERLSRESYNWFMNEAKKLAGGSLRDKVVKEETKRGRYLRNDPSQIHLGCMVMYRYDAKHKDDLPYWDAFPVGFLIKTTEKTFDILNLHYISPRYRAIILQELMNITNNKRFDETTKLKLSYDLIKGAAKLKILKATYHTYLHTHVKSRIIKVNAKDWEKVALLPLQNFQKAPSSVVWSDSVIKTR